jgi:surface polysaccharide O-acyltransferase-like enzyme
MNWLDASRIFAAIGVVLIHCTSDIVGLPYGSVTEAQRIGPMVLRGIAELSGSELFFLFSLFLLAHKLDRRSAGYRETIRAQAQRLLVPFAAWTLFYVLFRFVKADALGYHAALFAQLGQFKYWVQYFLLGSAQYHLHFLPTMFALVLLYPAMEAAKRFPVLGLLILPMIFLLDVVQGYVWGHFTDPMQRDCLLRIVKIACYSGYGFAAFSLYAIFKRGLTDADWASLFKTSLLLIAIGFMAKLTYTHELIGSGQWGVRPVGANYAHFLLPVAIFMAFLCARRFRWPSWVSWIARYTFGVYLIHPAFIDLYDVATHMFALRIDPTIEVLAKWSFALVASFGSAYALSKMRPTAWLVGLGPVPLGWLTHAKIRPAPLPTAAR